MINTVLHESDIFGLKIKPYYSLSLLTKDKRASHFLMNLTKGVIKRRTKYLRVTPKIVWEKEKTVDFSFNFSEGVKFYGKITKLLRPAIINKGRLLRDERTNKESFWIVQIPHGYFDGVLEIKDRKQKLTGYVYQDHQWGNINIQYLISDWTWGHFGTRDKAVIFFKILTQNRKVVDRSLIIDKNKIVLNSDFQTGRLNSLSKKMFPDEQRSVSEIYFPKNRLKLKFFTSEHNIMRKRLKEKYADFKATYIRWSSLGKLYSSGKSIKMPGITEYLRIRI